MANYAVIGPDSTVINVVVWDGVTNWPHDEVVEDLTDWPAVGIGWTYNPKATVNKVVDNRPKPDDDLDAVDSHADLPHPEEP